MRTFVLAALATLASGCLSTKASSSDGGAPPDAGGEVSPGFDAEPPVDAPAEAAAVDASCGAGFANDAGQCAAVDSCLTDNGGCDTHATCTSTGPGTSTCACNAGYSGSGTTCASIDNCATNNGGCDADATCTSTGPGTSTCACNAGYSGSGTTCASIDNCATNNGGCDALATCTSTGPGTSTCACNAGYSGSGTTCASIDNCATNNGGCDALATCTSTGPGTSTCACNAGYSGDGTTCSPTVAISSFSPTSGAVGAVVTITGTNFDPTPANDKVKFNGTAATVSAASATSLSVAVPAGATTGSITVTVAGQTATSSSSFTVIPPPTVSGFSPASGPPGVAPLSTIYPPQASVTITGTNFSSTAASDTVKFNGAPATFIAAASATSLTVAVPCAATSGPISVTVGGLTATSTDSFTVLSSAVITTVAGVTTTGYSGDNGPATSAEMNQPNAVAFDGSGNLYIADSSNSRIRKVSTSGIITTVAGNGTLTFSGDNGPATSAGLYYPGGVASDASGNLYISDSNNGRIRKVAAATGTITTVAGNGNFGFSGDGGPATNAELNSPYRVALDSKGNIYISDLNNNRIRMVAAATGIITTVAGNGTAGFSGDGSLATSAELNQPSGLAVDGQGNLYIADVENTRVRMVAAGTGIITTVAGGGGSLPDSGPATSAQLGYVEDVEVDPAGNLYVVDSQDYVILKVASGTGIISVVTGAFAGGYAGDGGPAICGKLNSPLCMAIDAQGNISVADAGNNRIRKITFP